VDNWSGASLLPSLLYSLSDEPRRHTFIFIAFTGEELGMLGSDFYAKSLTPEQRSRIEAMINTDSESFVKYKIPRITIHSVTQETWALLHSDKDKLSAIKMGDYYETYRLLAGYLAYLDGHLGKSPAQPVTPHGN